MKYLNVIKILLLSTFLLLGSKNIIFAQCPVATAGTFNPTNVNATGFMGLNKLPNANFSQFYSQPITQNLFVANPIYIIAPLVTPTGIFTDDWLTFWFDSV